MNDNIKPDSIGHASALALLSDVHCLMAWLADCSAVNSDRLNLEILETDFAFWRDELAKELSVKR